MGFIFFFVIYVEVFVFYFNDVGFFVGVDYYVWKGVVYYEECVKFSFDFVCVFYDVGQLNLEFYFCFVVEDGFQCFVNECFKKFIYFDEYFWKEFF